MCGEPAEDLLRDGARIMNAFCKPAPLIPCPVAEPGVGDQFPKSCLDCRRRGAHDRQRISERVVGLPDEAHDRSGEAHRFDGEPAVPADQELVDDDLGGCRPTQHLRSRYALDEVEANRQTFATKCVDGVDHKR